MRAYECIYTTRRRAVLGTPTHAQETFSVYSRNSRQPPPSPPRLLRYRVHRALRRTTTDASVCVRARGAARVCVRRRLLLAAAVVQYLVPAIPTTIVGRTIVVVLVGGGMAVGCLSVKKGYVWVFIFFIPLLFCPSTISRRVRKPNARGKRTRPRLPTIPDDRRPPVFACGPTPPRGS